MALRASSPDKEVDLMAAVDSSVDSGVPSGAELVAFAEAVLGKDDAVLAASRSALLREVGPAGFVDAAATVATFEQMDRIADSTGIPLDPGMTQDFHGKLGLDRFGSAVNSPKVVASQEA